MASHAVMRTAAGIVLIALLLAQATALSRSKLSVHTGPNTGGNTQSFVQKGQPRIIKLFNNFDQAANIKKWAPGVITIGRIYLQSQPQDGDPESRAKDWYDSVASTLHKYRDVIDYWEGYNEPGVGSESAASWYAQFEVHRLRILNSYGYNAVVGCFSAGTPDVTNAAIIQALYPMFDAAIQANAPLAVHEYSAPFMANDFDNSTGLGWLTGRYRRLYQTYLNPTGRGSLRLVVTETGIDGGVIGQSGGWKTYCSGHEDYVEQLRWYDSLLRADDYVLGATVFLMDGTSDWDSFSVDGPAGDMLAEYLQQCC